MNRLVRNPEGDSGAVAIIVAICLVLLFLLVGLAIDLGLARADVRDNQTISDFASVAAVNALRGGLGYEAACLNAVDYVFANGGELKHGSTEWSDARDQCSPFQALDSSGCFDDPDDTENPPTDPPVSVDIPAPPFTITIMSPVPDDDPTMTIEGQTVNEEIDGGPCDRVKVTIVRQRDYIFGPVTGNLSGNPAADAVGVYFEEPLPDDIASLIVLEQEDCNALSTNGTNAGFMVTDRVEPDGTRFPGRITVDSNGTGDGHTGGPPQTDCTPNNRYTIVPSTGTICAEADVGSHALGAGDETKSHPPGTGTAACLPPSGTTGLGVDVIPRPTRYGRSSVDWLVNCKGSYPAYNTSGDQRYPFYGDTPACPPPAEPSATPLPPFIDNLHGQLNSGPLTGAGFEVVSSCPNSANLTKPTPGATKIHVTCDPKNVNSITFEDVTHVVFDHSVPQQVTNLTVTGGSAGAVVYFRDEGIRRTNSGSTTAFENVFVYVNSATGLGVDTNGGNVDWTSIKRTFDEGKPVMHPDCNMLDQLMDPVTEPPTAACFAPLALWSNSNSEHTFGGNGVQFISGSYFMPNAHVVLNGSGTATFTDAQFFGRTMVASGNGFVTLTPNPETNIPPPNKNFGLIR